MITLCQAASDPEAELSRTSSGADLTIDATGPEPESLAATVDQCLRVLADDATLVSDGGGRIAAARRAIVGAEQVARFLAGLGTKFAGRFTTTPERLNHADALVVRVDGEIDQVVWLGVAEGRVARLYLVRNPDKLKALAP